MAALYTVEQGKPEITENTNITLLSVHSKTSEQNKHFKAVIHKR